MSFTRSFLCLKFRVNHRNMEANSLWKRTERKCEAEAMREQVMEALQDLPRGKEGLSKCGRCKQAFYCNVECQKEDWPMHKLECASMCAFGQNWNPSETVRLTARILAKQKTHPERTQSEKLLAVTEFESHIDKLDNEKRELIQNDIAALHHFYSKHLDYPDNAALVVLFAQVNCNGFTVEDEELSHLGSAIFPDVALMNHSCCPNVIVTYKGTLAEVRAVKDIEPGDEIFSSYIDLLYPTEDRNDRLRDSYFFNCDCRECITKEKDKEKLEICKLKDPPSAETVKNMIKYARNVIEEFRRAKHYKYILCLTLTTLAWCVTSKSHLLEL
ncbi:SET and MYND domain containing 2 [Willisornis vidua]|uniref:[histone H3]-lysine(4) N-trimethyltransferase n=1 Tax=Willisornis vidua TaxID=1566151 RepID=A0ABQ9CVU7_9PASS|nr:SET and MYND domain containing 2 [Willisornis vidua]